MDMINRIINHPVFQREMNTIKEQEKERRFCSHQMEHLLDAARLAYIFNLEEQAGLDKETVYGAALLHDIGRGRQYLDGTPHHEAGAALAEEILSECGAEAGQRQMIVGAIIAHRRTDAAGETAASGSERIEEDAADVLSRLLYRADKLSRCCWMCAAGADCNWPEEKKNSAVKY